MDEAMVTSRMPASKKERAARILQRSGLNASKAINLLYDRIIEDGDASFLIGSNAHRDADTWENAARFIDGLSERRESRLHAMSKTEIKQDRLRQRGLM